MATLAKRAGLVWSLVLCLVLVNGLMAAPSVAHAVKHGSHHGETHGTGLCAWFCTAGQAVETSSISLDSTLRLADGIVFHRVDQHERPFTSVTFLRGPPLSSLR